MNRFIMYPWIIWAVLIPSMILLLVSIAPVSAAERFVFAYGRTRVVLHDDLCRIHEVANLPLRAVATVNGQTVEGCWGFEEHFGMVLFYFLNRRVQNLPASLFTVVEGA